MGCGRASGAPDSSRRQPETTQEGFRVLESYPPAAQTRQNRRKFIVTRQVLVPWPRGKDPWKKKHDFQGNGDWLSRGFFATSKLTYVLQKTEGSKLQLRERS